MQNARDARRIMCPLIVSSRAGKPLIESVEKEGYQRKSVQEKHVQEVWKRRDTRERACRKSMYRKEVWKRRDTRKERAGKAYIGSVEKEGYQERARRKSIYRKCGKGGILKTTIKGRAEKLLKAARPVPRSPTLAYVCRSEQISQL